MAIRDWPEDERPREKLLARGPAALSDAELLAILLRTGVRGMNAVELARELIRRFGNLNQLFAASESQLCDVTGMGPAKYVQFQAILEIARRVLVEELKRGDVLSSPQAVRDFLRLYFQKHQREAFVADGQLSLDRTWKTGKMRAVAWLQGRRTRHVYGAATAALVQ